MAVSFSSLACRVLSRSRKQAHGSCWSFWFCYFPLLFISAKRADFR